MTSWDRKKAPGRPPMSSSRSPPLYTAPSARGPIFTGRAEAHGAPWCWRALLLLRMVECRSRAHRSRRCAVGAPPNGAEQIAARRAAAKCRARAAACGVERVDLPVGQPREEARRDDGDRVCLREGAELRMDFASGSELRFGFACPGLVGFARIEFIRYSKMCTHTLRSIVNSMQLDCIRIPKLITWSPIHACSLNGVYPTACKESRSSPSSWRVLRMLRTFTDASHLGVTDRRKACSLSAVPCELDTGSAKFTWSKIAETLSASTPLGTPGKE